MPLLYLQRFMVGTGNFLCRSGLVSLEPQNGKELWRQEFPFKVSTASSPVVANDHIFCSAGYGVGAGVFKISFKGGKWESDLVWRKRNELMNHWSTPLYYQGNLYGIFGFKEYGKAPSAFMVRYAFKFSIARNLKV